MEGPWVVCLMVVLLLASFGNTVRAEDAEYEYYYEEVSVSPGNDSETNPNIKTAVPNARTLAPATNLSTSVAETSSTTVATIETGTKEAVTSDSINPMVEFPTIQPDFNENFTIWLNNSRRWVNTGINPHPDTARPSGVWQSASTNPGRDYIAITDRGSVSGKGSAKPLKEDFGRPEIVLNIYTDMYGQGTRNRNNRGGNSWSKGGRNSYWNSYQNSLQGWYGWQGHRNNGNYGMPSWQQSRGNPAYRGRQPMTPSNSNRRPQAVPNSSNRRNADQQASEALYSFLMQILQGSQVKAAASGNHLGRNNNRRPS